MSVRWLIRMPDKPAAEWSWLETGGPLPGETVQGDLAQLFAAVAAAPGHPVTLLLPSDRVLTMPVAVPVRQQRQMQQAFPFLVEENLAGEVEHCHVVAGLRIDARRLQLAAVDRRWFAALLAELRAGGIDPVTVSSEALVLTAPERGVVLLLDGAASLLATADGQTLMFDQADAAALPGGMPAGEGGNARILLGMQGDVVAARALESEWLAAGAQQVAIDEAPRERLAILAEELARRAPVNLRQGEFAHAGETTFSLGFDWRPLAWMAACWAVLALGYQAAVGITHDRAARAVHEAQVTLYRQVFPGAKNVPNPRAQMTNQLRSGGGGASFTALVAQTSETLAALEKTGVSPAGETHYRPRTLAWDAEQGQLRVDIVARGLEDLERLRQALEKRGLAVDIGSGVSQDGGYKARLNIAPAAPLAGGVP
ncbi:MAG: type II secretion system protein GspL [Pseudomonadota bacterium]